MLVFDCPHCGRRFEVGDEFAGRKVRCKACEQVFIVPGGPDEPVGEHGHAPPPPPGGETPPSPPPPYGQPRTPQPQAWSQPPAHGASRAAHYYPPVKPGAVTFYTVYLVLMIVLYLFCAAMGAVLLAVPANQMQGRDAAELRVMGAVYLTVGLVLMIPFIVGLFIRKGKAAWIYGIVMIAIGLTSCACWPVSIPLLVFWLQDPTRRYFNAS